MSLIAWYPLKDDIKDYALENNQYLTNAFTSNIVQDVTNGKLGKSYNFSGTGYLFSENIDGVYYGNKVTYSAWINPASMVEEYIPIVNNFNSSGTTGSNIALCIHNGHLSIAIPNRNTSSFVIFESTAVIIANKWQHVTATVDVTTREIKFYLDGKYIDTVLIGGVYLPFTIKATRLLVGAWSWNIRTPVYSGKMNDLRVYDEILTQRQIREIYKTCILHYTFNDPYAEPTINLIPINDSKWYINKSNYSSVCNIITGIEPWVETGARFIFSEKIDPLESGWQVANYDTGLTSFDIDKEYTLSFDLRMLNDNDISIRLLRDNGQDQISPIAVAKYSDYSDWKRFSMTFTPLLASILTSANIYITCATQLADFMIANPQLEIKNHDTPFVNGTRNDGIYDVSDYANHGSMIVDAAPEFTSKTKYGSGAFKFNGLNSSISCQNNNRSFKDYSFSCWIYAYDYNQYRNIMVMYDITTTDRYGRLMTFGNNTLRFNPYLFGSYLEFTDMPIKTWIHIAATWDSVAHKAVIYKNGEKYKEGIFNELDIPSGDIEILIGNDYGGARYFNGLIGDTRIYATVLSDEDVKFLYQSKYTLDVNGDFYSTSIVEKDMSSKVDGTIDFNKKGLLEAQAIDEISIYGCPFKQLDDGSKWAKVFYHRNESGTILFADANEVLDSLNNINKFSRLSILERFRGSDDKFEFLLEYPEDATGYNRWKQTSNPAEVTTPNNGVIGYEPISISWNFNNWGGLEYNGGPNTFIDGSIGAGFYYAIGAYTKYHNSIPGPSTNVIDFPPSDVESVALYVRVDGIEGVDSHNFKFSKDYIFMGKSIGEK